MFSIRAVHAYAYMYMHGRAVMQTVSDCLMQYVFFEMLEHVHSFMHVCSRLRVRAADCLSNSI